MVENAVWCLIWHVLLKEKWSKLRDGELAKLFPEHFRIRTKVTASFFALNKMGSAGTFWRALQFALGPDGALVRDCTAHMTKKCGFLCTAFGPPASVQ